MEPLGYLAIQNALFFADVKNDVKQTGHFLINTVAKNETKYTMQDYSDTVHACTIQEIIGCPSTKNYIVYVRDDLSAQLK